MNFPPLTSTPFLEADPIPAKKERGTEITRAHGQDATKKTSERIIHVSNGCCKIKGGRKATAIAHRIIMGV